MMNKMEKENYTTSERVALSIFGILLALYFLNIFLGKAAIHWGWNVVYLGNVSEFLLLLAASIAFVVAALHHKGETDRKQK